MTDDMEPVRRFRDEVPNPDGESWASARAALMRTMHPGRVEQPRRSWAVRARQWRPLALIAVLVLGSGTAALAAVGAFRSGTPVPPSNDPAAKLLVGGSSVLLSIRTPDPAGGSPWGVRLVHYSKAGGYGPDICGQLGRVVNGELGWLGEDGAFSDDGLFHAADPASYGASCTSGSGGTTIKSLVGTGGTAEAVANGEAQGCSRVTRRVKPDASAGTYLARALTARLAVLRAGGAPARSLARRYGVTLTVLIAADRSALTTIRLRAAGEITSWTDATCPPGSLRTIYYGYAGPNAVTVSLTGHGIHESVPVHGANAGAFLFVLAGPPSRWYGEYRSVTCRNGRTYSHGWVCPEP
jgi:hypothetical protein